MKFLIIVLIPLLSACAATSSPSTDNTSAQLDYIDLTAELNKERLDNYWVSYKKVEPRFPLSAAKKGISGCVDLVIGINSEGKAQGYKVRSSYPKGVFDKSAAAAIAKWRWKAAEANPERKPVLTSYQLDFTVNTTRDREKYMAHCVKDKA
ncbi:TonB [Shewanella piezotolerans WP3]|uniref:TonB n=1 Tax=Shewanella piezotolerans (strain WP3 / JCM 13877) TaxID=225849 RepID=B8CS44_SHEPW|nr:energy transducer TonB [Shewanella piezotolerans]ACJ30334.1 TonB [Shewanella piezotolerans WP3]